MVFGPIADGVRSGRMCQLVENGGWYENTRVQPLENLDVLNENQIVDWRCIGYYDHQKERITAVPLAFSVRGASPDLARNRRPYSRRFRAASKKRPTAFVF